ncbi:hypothetical protein KSC_002020 [Ktedonobacter sp. SOSP1-52]|nr:hypothetical protein KSC_002020 [Ktedonobacter sp. SOSP1-52]
MPRGNLETCQRTLLRPPDAVNGEGTDARKNERAMHLKNVIEVPGGNSAIERISGVWDMTRK